MAKYQQGDVLFIEVNEGKWKIDVENNIHEDSTTGQITKDKTYKMVPTDYERSKFFSSKKYMKELVTGGDEGRLTVAFGEATGHSHKFDMVNHDPKVAIMSFGQRTTSVGPVPEYINITGGPATIKHEEHAPLTIPQGHYKVSIVREYDHMLRRARLVVD